MNIDFVSPFIFIVLLQGVVWVPQAPSGNPASSVDWSANNLIASAGGDSHGGSPCYDAVGAQSDRVFFSAQKRFRGQIET